MEAIYTIIENLAVFVCRDLIFKIALPLLLITLGLNLLFLCFSKEDKREEMIKSIQAKVIGLIILVFLPAIIGALLNIIQQVTGIEANIDMSILYKLQKSAPVTQVTPSVSNNQVVPDVSNNSNT